MNTIQTKSFNLAVYSKGNESAEKLALVLPGRLDTKDYVHMKSLVDFLAGLGYFALSFDPPGSWESNGDINQYTMSNYLKAINELIEHYGNKPTVLVGHSRGGSMAMLAGITNPYVTHFITVFSRPGPSSMGLEEARTKGVQVDYRDLPPGNVRTTEQKKFELPYSYFEDAAQYDMRDGLRECIKPKLFFVGLHDVDVKPGYVREAYEIAAEPKQLYELDSDHDYRLHPAIIEEVNRVIGSFLSKYSS